MSLSTQLRIDCNAIHLAGTEDLTAVAAGLVEGDVDPIAELVDQLIKTQIGLSDKLKEILRIE